MSPKCFEGNENQFSPVVGNDGLLFASCFVDSSYHRVFLFFFFWGGGWGWRGGGWLRECFMLLLLFTVCLFSVLIQFLEFATCGYLGFPFRTMIRKLQPTMTASQAIPFSSVKWRIVTQYVKNFNCLPFLHLPRNSKGCTNEIAQEFGC